jgi:hypothetical protein
MNQVNHTKYVHLDSRQQVAGYQWFQIVLQGLIFLPSKRQVIGVSGLAHSLRESDSGHVQVVGKSQCMSHHNIFPKAVSLETSIANPSCLLLCKGTIGKGFEMGGSKTVVLSHIVICMATHCKTSHQLKLSDLSPEHLEANMYVIIFYSITIIIIIILL